MKKIMYEIAGLALLCSTCIGTAKAAPEAEGLELEDIGLQNTISDKTNAGVKNVQNLGEKLIDASVKKSDNPQANSLSNESVAIEPEVKAEASTEPKANAESENTSEPEAKVEETSQPEQTENSSKEVEKKPLKFTKADRTEIIPTKKTESSEESKEEPKGPKIEKPKTGKLNIVLAKDKDSNVEKAAEASAEPEAKVENKNTESEAKSESSTEPEAAKTSSDKELFEKVKVKLEAQDKKAAKEYSGPAVKDLFSEEDGKTAASKTANKEVTEVGPKGSEGLNELFGEPELNQNSEAKSAEKALPEISKEELGRNIPEELSKTDLKAISLNSDALSESLSKVSANSEAVRKSSTYLKLQYSQFAEKLKESFEALKDIEAKQNKHKGNLEILDKAFDSGSADMQTVKDALSNIESMRKLADQRKEHEENLSIALNQFVKIAKSELTSIDSKLTSSFEQLDAYSKKLKDYSEESKNYLKSIADYSAMLEILDKQIPNIFDEQQKELEKTQVLWNNHESSILREEAIAKGEKHHEKEQKEPKTPFDGSAVKDLSSIVEQARKELDVIDVSKEDFTKSKVLNGTDWSSFAGKFDVEKVDIQNNQKGLASEIKKELENFVKLKDSINSQADSDISDENQDEGIRITKRLKNLLSSLGKVDLTDEDKSIAHQKKLIALSEELLDQAGKAQKAINVKDFKVDSFNRAIVTTNWSSYVSKFGTAKVVDDQKSLVDDVKAKLDAFNSWISSTQSNNGKTTSKNKKNKLLVSKNDQRSGLKAVKALISSLTSCKEKISVVVEKAEKAAQGANSEEAKTADESKSEATENSKLNTENSQKASDRQS